MVRLTKHQLFTLTFIFQVGSTPLFALGIEAEQDAWIVILLSLLIGLVMAYISTELFYIFPDKNLIEIINIILGKKIGIPLCISYAMVFIWACGRNLREFSELIVLISLPHVHLWIIILSYILLTLYTLFKGFETLSRLSELIVPITIIFLISMFIIIIFFSDTHMKNLLPILGNGITPILKSLPGVMWFPFGEVFVLLLYWHYLNDKQAVRITTFKALISSGFLLCISTIVTISELGVKYTSLATIPLVETLRVINVVEVLSRIDILGIPFLILGGFFKICIYLNSLALTVNSVFKINNFKLTLVLSGIFMLFFSIYFEPSYAYHQWLFPFDARYFCLPYCTIYPTLLLLIYFIKSKRSKI
ncbi:GerAB/ArcD/ProY family transporter [Clostridium felsineum]|uniref:GerAB/ArcD/ProY family transporter n=1 Tax=Clostridium felsineum TaxID=36839 RepID=UPI00098C6DF9|nr:GerAB/ArcD/ProY family transporter [Clostridium felsineum]URZ18700.1 hypothetical protein CLFE_047880 [Clostridium felsineum DSM 794]